MGRRASALALLLLASGCQPEGCLSADSDCTVPTPCADLQLPCSGGTATVRELGPGVPAPGGIDALGSDGDMLLSNGVVSVVIDAVAPTDGIGHPHYIAPTGGNILDMTSASNADDSLTHVFHAVGLLPGDSVAYERMTTETGPSFAAVQVHGRLAGSAEARVATRYEIRPCEPGIRVRTEIVNLSGEPRIWSLVDGWYWSGREALPFGPGQGRGFEQPGIISPVEDSWEPFPYMVATSHTTPSASYFEVACNQPALLGWHSDQVSAQGLRPRMVQHGDFEVFERFIGVTSGRSVGPGADHALEIRRALFDEQFVTLRGTIASADPVGDEVRASIIVIEGTEETPVELRVPWTQITPRLGGAFDVRVPAYRDYLLSVEAFGSEELVRAVRVDFEDVDVGTIEIAAASSLNVAVTVDGVADWAQVLIHPGDDATDSAVRTNLFGGTFECAPMLGSPRGGTPACNRMMVNGSSAVALPPGTYDIYATAGLFATIARERVTVAAGEGASVALALERLDVVPAGTLGSDFHVHGGASFDSTVPDLDRVMAWLASNIDVIATTEHDVVWDFAAARSVLGADSRMQVMVGVEATGQILFDLTPGEFIPQVIGHWNAWPIPFAPDEPYNGAPWDELVEPGALFDRFVDAGWPRDTGVIQLNHPWSASQFGRDLGFPRAVGVDARVPLPRNDDDTGPGRVLRTPPGASFSNVDYDTQEVMNGTENEDFPAFRAYWFYLLNQGIVRAGTANSDSHGLVDNVLGTPRTLVRTDQVVGPTFDEAAFNADVRRGRMTGTNGPVIELSTLDTVGISHGPSTDAFAPNRTGMLSIRVSAAPWVPVEEIRIVVNGEVARTLQAELTHPSDPFGTDGIIRFEGEVALSEILPSGDADAWIVVEAGAALPEQADLDCDGIPDTGDIDGNGTIDWRDVERDEDEQIDEAPETCDPDQDVGPFAHPPEPGRDDAAYPFLAVTPGGYPLSFTNPLLLDRDGGGFDGPGLP